MNARLQSALLRRQRRDAALDRADSLALFIGLGGIVVFALAGWL